MTTLRQAAPGSYIEVAEQVFPAELASAPRARHHVTSVLNGWGLAPLLDDADLVAGELIANGIKLGQQCAQPEILVRVGRAARHVGIQVGDHGLAGPPQPRSAVPADSEHGRGLLICCELARVGWFQDGCWKVVWAALPAPEISEETRPAGRGQLGRAA